MRVTHWGSEEPTLVDQTKKIPLKMQQNAEKA